MIIITQSVDHLKFDKLKSCDVILTNVKEANILVKSCFVYYKSDHSFKKYFNQFTKINAVNNKYDCFNFDSNFDLKN